jgi:uncharacterized lipoprotein YmbA
LLRRRSQSRSPKPRFYTLASHPGAALSSGPWRIQLRRLDRQQIVRRTNGERLELSGIERWGAPMEEMVSASLLENLAEQLPNASVFAESGSTTLSPDALIEVQILRFERVDAGPVRLLPGCRSLGSHKKRRNSSATHSLRVPETLRQRKLCGSMSLLLGELSTAIAQLLLASAPTAVTTNPGEL